MNTKVNHEALVEFQQFFDHSYFINLRGIKAIVATGLRIEAWKNTGGNVLKVFFSDPAADLKDDSRRVWSVYTAATMATHNYLAKHSVY